MRAGVIAGLVGTATLLSSCADPEHERYLRRADSITLGAGDAAAVNRAVQTIDPWPRHAGNANIAMDGKKALLSVRRYQHDDIKMPTDLPGTDQYPGAWDGRNTPPLSPKQSDPYDSADTEAQPAAEGNQ